MDRDGPDNVRGIIYLANEARFTESRFSEPLSEYAAGWGDPSGILAMLEFVAPSVPAPRRFDYKTFTRSNAVLAEPDDVRAIGADFKKVDVQGTTASDMTLNKGLVVSLERDAIENTPHLAERYVGYLMRRLYLSDFLRAVRMLDAMAVVENKTWNLSEPHDPDQDVLGMQSQGEDAAGVALNRLLYGQEAYVARVATLRGSSTAGIASSAGHSPQQLALMLGVEEIRVSTQRYQKDSATRERVVPSAVYGFMAQSEPTDLDPSHLKRFVTPVGDGRMVRVYRFDKTTQVDLVVEHYSMIASTVDTGVRKFAISK